MPKISELAAASALTGAEDAHKTINSGASNAVLIGKATPAF